MGIDIGLDEVKTKPFWIAALAEFQATMLFLICVTTVVLGWGKNDVSANNVEIGLGIGLAIASLAYAFGHISGGHINPAVSLGCVVGGRISLIRGVVYIVAQCIGAIIGSAITYSCTEDSNRDKLGVTSLGPNVSVGQGFGLELIFTFLLVFFILSATDPKKNTEPYGTTLGIGIMIVVAHVSIIPFTGSSINPARSLGPAVMMNSWADHWIYWVAPFVGAIIAAVEYRFIFGVPENPRHDEERIPLAVESTTKYT